MARERWCESLSDQVATLPGLPGSEQGVGMKQTVPQHPPPPPSCVVSHSADRAERLLLPHFVSCGVSESVLEFDTVKVVGCQ